MTLVNNLHNLGALFVNLKILIKMSSEFRYSDTKHENKKDSYQHRTLCDCPDGMFMRPTLYIDIFIFVSQTSR